MFVVKADIPREEAKALYEYLNRLKTKLSAKDPNTVQQDQLDRKRLLEEIAVMKQDLKKNTEKLHAFADKVDKVQKDCMISKVVAHSTGAVSGVLSIVGLALAPLTMGVTLPLLATGLGLGIAAAMTNVSTSIVEQVNTSSAETKTSQLLPCDRKRWKFFKETPCFSTGFPGDSVVKNPSANTRDVCSIPGLGRSLEKEMAIHSNIFAWK
nr:PREDICTED: apolipoprotein L3 [Bos mutus]